MDKKASYKVIGLMSGTSLDGLDIAYCIFQQHTDGWKYRIQHAETIKYTSGWIAKLSQAHTLSAEEFAELDMSYGKLVGSLTANFVQKNKVRADFVSSHGHTIFHQPKKGFTTQLGSGLAIHAVTGLPVVYDFRTLDVLFGGQGAPLVPAGDKFLFSEYDVCLNLGGIANLSVDVKKSRKAFDICFVNMALNYLAGKKAKAYDKNGDMASAGEIDKKLLQNLEKIYSKLKKTRPSLGRELFESAVRPLLDNEKISLSDRLHTVSYAAAKEIAEAITSSKANAKVLCTGGGAFNTFLISQILDFVGNEVMVVIPEEQIVKFKEALVFGFLGVLRVRDEINCLKSVTGASVNSSSGILAGF
jgi:anhydro-N-acetylmuramic acid kinase